MLAAYFILYCRHYIQKLNFFNYEKHIVSYRSDPGYRMDSWIFRIQCIWFNPCTDRPGSYRLITGIDPQSVILN